MLRRRVWERILWSVCVATALVVLVVSRRAFPVRDAAALGAARGAVVTRLPRVTVFDGDTLAAAATGTVLHDVFRTGRHPSPVPFSVTVSGVSPTQPAAPPVRLVLRGTIGGPPWRAVLSGVPGHGGTVIVGPGDTLGGVSVRMVTRSGATVRAQDSTWVLTLSPGGTP